MTRRFRRSPYDRILVVGGGRAGVAAAEELRRLGFDGNVTLLCDEPEGPYDRPSCSKGLLTGHRRPQDVGMPYHDDGDLAWYRRRRAVEIDADDRRVTTDTGETFAYDGLVIATGAEATAPVWAGPGSGVHLLHTLADAWALRHALRRADRVVIVGGGITGCEVACAVRSLARDCVLVDPQPQLMSRALGEVVGRYVTEAADREGVDLRLGRRVRSVDRLRRGWLVELDDGEGLVGDLVVATVGARPDTGWLTGAGLDLSDGLVCDESLRVAGLDGVVAAGAVARWPNLRYGYQLRGCEHWIGALEQGRAVAHTLLAGDAEAPPVTVIPRFWSDQFGLRIQVCGELPVDGEVAITEMRPGRRDIARSGVVVGYHRDDRLVGLVAVNAAHAFTSIARGMLATPLPELATPHAVPALVPHSPAPALQPHSPAAAVQPYSPAPALEPHWAAPEPHSIPVRRRHLAAVG
jgi:NADPH-dependent 2,4-dienoyl-CoA reductase/sulfur reductase-like enzyme